MSFVPASEATARIVVCEDDPATLELLCDQLHADRYEALPAASATDALRLCRFESPDLLLLDLNLPDAPGLDVLRALRASAGGAALYDGDLPVIIVSGRCDPADRVRGLTEGADDFVLKPVSYPELEARVRSLLRRQRATANGPIRVGELSVDTASRRVRVGDREPRLAKREFDLLRALAAEPYRVFTKQELLRDVWGFLAAGRTRTVDSHASRVRRKLDPENGRYVVNVWGVGYRLLDR